MAFDYKKEYKEFYLPPRKPGIVTVPPMNFVSVQGRGDPNEPGGEYQAAMELLYGIAFTIKMSYKGSHKIDGYFEYVVPPLEGLWHQEGVDKYDPPAGFRDPGSVRLGRSGSDCKKEEGFLQSAVPPL